MALLRSHRNLRRKNETSHSEHRLLILSASFFSKSSNTILPKMRDKSVIINAHRALNLPEIVGEILFWLDKGPIYLMDCALVNKTWFHEAIRILWSDLEVHGINLEEGVMGISPDRRQMYANLVKIASFAAYRQETESVFRPALESVVFPQLHTSYLVLGLHDLGTDKCIRIPAVNMPSLQTLYVKYVAGPRYLYPDQWDYLAELIPVYFTGYLLLHYVTDNSAYPEALSEVGKFSC